MVERYLSRYAGRQRERSNDNAITNTLLSTQNAVKQDAINRVGSLARTKQSVDNFNREQDELVRQAYRRRRGAAIGLLFTIAGAAIGGGIAASRLGASVGSSAGAGVPGFSKHAASTLTKGDILGAGRAARIAHSARLGGSIGRSIGEFGAFASQDNNLGFGGTAALSAGILGLATSPLWYE